MNILRDALQNNINSCGSGCGCGCPNGQGCGCGCDCCGQGCGCGPVVSGCDDPIILAGCSCNSGCGGTAGY